MKLYRDPATGAVYQYREGKAPAGLVPVIVTVDEDAESRPNRPRRRAKSDPESKARNPRNKARVADDK